MRLIVSHHILAAKRLVGVKCQYLLFLPVFLVQKDVKMQEHNAHNSVSVMENFIDTNFFKVPHVAC